MVSVPRADMEFFLDQNVAKSVGTALEAMGYPIVLLRDVMPTDSSDSMVALTCSMNSFVLVTHDKDFSIAKTAGLSKAKVKSLNRILLRCSEFTAAERIKAEMPLIQLEWELSLSPALNVELSKNMLRLYRGDS